MVHLLRHFFLALHPAIAIDVFWTRNSCSKGKRMEVNEKHELFLDQPFIHWKSFAHLQADYFVAFRNK